MCKVIKLKSNELPREASKVFPQFDIKEAKILSTKYDPTSGDDYTFIKRYSALVPIKRHGFYYLIPFMKQFEKPIRNINDRDLVEFHEQCIKDCEKIIDKFIVDPEWENNPVKDEMGMYFKIYKYVD